LITIHLNGETREIPEGLTVAALLTTLQMPADRVAVERNLEIVPRAHWQETPLQPGDRLEIVQFVGGGSPSGRTDGSDARAVIMIPRRERMAGS
jgi:thiamine biosynthesis protein ThiS